VKISHVLPVHGIGVAESRGRQIVLDHRGRAAVRRKPSLEKKLAVFRSLAPVVLLSWFALVRSLSLAHRIFLTITALLDPFRLRALL